MGGDSASNVRIQATGEVRASLDFQTGPDGTPVIVRASFDVVENPALSKWYKAPNQDELKDQVQLANDANQRAEKEVRALRLLPDEERMLGKFSSIEEFVTGMNDSLNSQQEKTSKGFRNKTQQALVNLDSFAKSFDCIVGMLTQAPTFGASQVVVGVFALITTTAGKKQAKEEMMNSFMYEIANVLPRLQAYSALYPTPRMIQKVASLYSKMIDFLLAAFIYHRKGNIVGTISRTWTSLKPNDRMSVLVSEIKVILKDVHDDGIMGLSTEFRRASNLLKNAEGNMEKLKMESRKMSSNLAKVQAELGKSALELKQCQMQLGDLKNDLSKARNELSEANKKLSDADERGLRQDLERLKKYLVHPRYDEHELLKNASEIILQQHLNTKQKACCSEALESPTLANWEKLQTDHSDGAAPALTWLTGQKLGHKVSHISRQLLESVSSRQNNGENQRLIVLHSFDHGSDRPHRASGDEMRTPITILKEAIFLLLQQVPQLIRSDDILQTFLDKEPTLIARGEQNLEARKDFTFLKLAHLLHALFRDLGNQCLCAQQQTVDPKNVWSVYWIIDRLDTCQFRSKQFRTLPRLSEFAAVLEKLNASYCSPNKDRHHKLEKKGFVNMYLVVTSRFEPANSDDCWLERADENNGYEMEINQGGMPQMWHEILA